MPDPDGEMYWDAVKGEMRPRIGRRRGHGPMNVEEANAYKAWYRLIRAGRRMHGEMEQIALRDVTAYLTSVALLFEKNSYRNVRDLSSVDMDAFREEIGVVSVSESVSVEDHDMYEDLT